jgi:glycosyltransferase involved in cell wall biosynthesis
MQDSLIRTCSILFLVVEGRMSGIPVLAANRGGIPEQLEDHWFLFDIPQKCLDHFGTVPDDPDVQPWLDTLIRLMDDDAAYTAAAVPAKGRDFRHKYLPTVQIWAWFCFPSHPAYPSVCSRF